MSDEAVNSALEEYNKIKEARIAKMVNDGAAIASKQQDEITEELVNETVKQKAGTADQKIALAVVNQAVKNNVDVEDKPEPFHLDTKDN